MCVFRHKAAPSPSDKPTFHWHQDKVIPGFKFKVLIHISSEWSYTAFHVGGKVVYLAYPPVRATSSASG